MDRPRIAFCAVSVIRLMYFRCLMQNEVFNPGSFTEKYIENFATLNLIEKFHNLLIIQYIHISLH